MNMQIEDTEKGGNKNRRHGIESPDKTVIKDFKH